MSTRNVPPDIQALFSKVSSRLDVLERRLHALEAAYEPELPFVQSGAISVGQSPPWMRRKGGKLVEFVVLLGTAGSSPTVVAMLKNGVVIGTALLDAGVDQVHVTMSEPAAPDADRFVAAVTTAGSGAADLTVATRWDQ